MYIHKVSHCLRLAALTAMLFGGPGANAAITVEDDAGTRMVFDKPVTRIVSLAPHITELLFAAGAGAALIAADEYSDFPPAARVLPRIGNAYALDLEAMLALHPDLIIAWKSGNDARQVTKLRALGLKVFLSEPGELDDIPRTLETFGRLVGSDAVAQPAAKALRARAAALQSRYASRRKVRVFFEIWSPPIMTINGKHMIASVLTLCGAENPFAALTSLTPNISPESVVAANPEVILASGMGSARPAYLDEWARWPQMPAVKNALVLSIPGDLITRSGPRIFDGADEICATIDKARAADTPASTGNK